MGSMVYSDFVLAGPLALVALSAGSAGVWLRQRKHLYLLWWAGALLCAALAYTVWGMNTAYKAMTQWGAAAMAILAAIAVAQAMSQRFGRNIHPTSAGATVVLVVLGTVLVGQLAPTVLQGRHVLAFGLALLLGHGLPALWRLASRHQAERVLLYSYSAVCALVALSPWLVPAMLRLGANLGLVLAGVAGLFTLAMFRCVWSDTPAYLYAERERDELTGLLNPHGFEQACGPHPAEQHINFLVLCDLDHFKRINQKFGTAVGDEALRHFAQLLQNSVRGGDLVARIGGDEFALALRHIDLANTQALVQRIMAAQQHWASTVSLGTLTASFGIAIIREHDTLQMALHRADVLVCQAKDEGSNRLAVEVHLPEGALAI